MPHFEPCAQCGNIKCTCILGGGSDMRSQSPPKTPMPILPPPNLTIKTQIGGDHYLILPIQPWTIIDANRLNFYEGCALKYLLRKKGNRVEELEKAIHYLEHEVEYLKGVRPKQCLQCGGPSNEKDILYYGCCVKCAFAPENDPAAQASIQQQEEPGWDQGFWICGNCGNANNNYWRVCLNCQKEK